MKTRETYSSSEVKAMNTQGLRSAFLIDDWFVPGHIQLTYSHYDRMIIGSVQPMDEPIALTTYTLLKSDYFLERRELGIINLGSKGEVLVNDQTFVLDQLDVLYLGQGIRHVHSACSFVWGMAGENKYYIDMDTLTLDQVK